MVSKSNSRNSDLSSTEPHSFSDRSHKNSSTMATVLRNPIPSSDSTPKTVEDVWREIVSGNRKECKQEAPDELITLEDFLARAGASMEVDDGDFKVPPSEQQQQQQRWSDRSVFALDPNPSSFQGKRTRSVLEPLDRAAQQRQRRMIKNRESAARSRERKQAYQVELESLAVRLEDENVKLLKEKMERTKKRFKQLMEKVVPVVEKQGAVRVLRRVRSLQW